VHNDAHVFWIVEVGGPHSTMMFTMLLLRLVIAWASSMACLLRSTALLISSGFCWCTLREGGNVSGS
jgi:hypothetical protein